MKLKKELVLRKIAGEYIVVPVGRLVRVSPMMRITSSTAWLWDVMKAGEFTQESLVSAVMEHFSGVTEEVAAKDVHNFLKLLEGNYMLEDGRPEPLTGRTTVKVPPKQARRLEDGNADQ